MLGCNGMSQDFTLNALLHADQYALIHVCFVLSAVSFQCNMAVPTFDIFCSLHTGGSMMR
jgi:hypothetical protein